MQEQELEFTLDQQMDVFGVQDSNAKLIENALSVSINARNSHVEILGDSEQAVPVSYTHLLQFQLFLIFCYGRTHQYQAQLHQRDQ